MVAINSRSAGVILFPKHESSDYTVIDVVEGVEKDPVEAQYLYSTVKDWEEMEGDDKTAQLELASRGFWLERTVSHIRLAIGGLEESLEKRVLEDIEENLGSRVSSEEVLDQLLIAPLLNPESPVALSKIALSYGVTSIASILDSLADLQPLLSRFSDYWLSVPEEAYSNFPESREMLWITLIEKGRIIELLKAGDKRDFEAKWNLLAWDFDSPLTRAGISKLGKTLSHSLFPSDVSDKRSIDIQTEDAEPIYGDEEGLAGGVHEAFQRAQKQILAIAKAISEGRDARAHKFLRELIKEQTSVTGGKRFAVKSLCNIAQYCADMFRTDFEDFCLEKALELIPDDGWTLVQLGDHFKRVGNYEKALKVLDLAQHSRESEVAISSIADVYSEQGQYEKAINIYKSIPQWESKSAVLTAIADNHRKMGDFVESTDRYNTLIELGQQGLPEYVSSMTRAKAGLAEIAKREGRFTEALIIYREILVQKSEDDRDNLFYKLGLCNVLKLKDEYEEAYTIIDDIIEEYPFALQARFIRGSILGLIGDDNEGLKDLPEGTVSRSWREWLRRYYRGLLLFKLGRYEDAKKNLVEEVNKAIASKEEKSLLRMAAALCYLRENDNEEADEMLSEIPDLYDSHIQYLSLVLKLHLATRNEERAKIKHLKRHIAKLQVRDEGLDKAVMAIDKRNFRDAFNYETVALLKLAA